MKSTGSGWSTLTASAVAASSSETVSCGISRRWRASSSYKPEAVTASNSSWKTRFTWRYSTPARLKTNPLGSRNELASGRPTTVDRETPGSGRRTW